MDDAILSVVLLVLLLLLTRNAAGVRGRCSSAGRASGTGTGGYLFIAPPLVSTKYSITRKCVCNLVV